MSQKSDAQLDAEAAVSLSELIRAHRTYYSRDLYIPRLATEEPPVFTDPDTGKRASDPMSRLGPTLSYPLTAFIASETRMVEEGGQLVEHPGQPTYTPNTPWSKAAFAQWAACRRTHPEHWERDEFRGSLCKVIVGLVIRQGWNFERACYELRLDPDRTAKVLRSALLFIDREMERIQDKADRLHKEDEGHFVGKDAQGRWAWEVEIPEHHRVPGLHEVDCPNPVCRESKAA